MKMGRIFPPLFALLMLSAFLVSPASGEDSRMKALVDGNTAFALDIYGKLSKMEGNLFLSPHSISTALAMTYGGARGETEKQMAETLHFGLEQKDLHEAFAGLEARLNRIQEEGHVALNVANSLWPQKDYLFLEEYLSLVERHYGVSISPVDYRTDAEAVRQRINRWVEEKTREKIQELLQPGVLDPMTRLVLVNAIHFKGNWRSQFPVDETQDAPFHTAPGETVQAPLMTQQEFFPYAHWDSLQILELPYEGEDLSMLILLPRDADGLKALERELSPDNLRMWKCAMQKREVRVHLPRFKMTSTFRLDNTLASMGMPDAFLENRADFSGMDGRPGWLHIGAVVHKGFVEVNEEGTEAAAATAVGIRATAMPAPPPEFRADRPFIFFIKENQTGSILFMGRVTDPTQQGE